MQFEGERHLLKMSATSFERPPELCAIRRRGRHALSTIFGVGQGIAIVPEEESDVVAACHCATAFRGIDSAPPVGHWTSEITLFKTHQPMPVGKGQLSLRLRPWKKHEDYK